MKETEEQILERLKEEIQRSEQAKKRCEDIAKKSFENWSTYNMSKISRAFGYLIVIPKNKFGKIWNWLWK